MPELPEVETVKRGLKGFLLGNAIVKITTLSEKSFIGNEKAVLGRKILDIKRRGKALIVVFERGMNLMIHLRMTGQLIYVGQERFGAGHPDREFLKEMPGKHTRVWFEFDDGAKLFFNDQRKFGFVKVMGDEEIAQDAFLNKLGPEPWELDGKEFFKRLQRRKNTTAKAAILDQSVIAGVGNIYADESLYYAGIFPGRKVMDIPETEAERLLEGVRKVMDKSIESGGSTMKDYVKADGTTGDYLDKFAKVFNRTGQRCERCGGEIRKTKVAGRGTHYCPGCQK